MLYFLFFFVSKKNKNSVKIITTNTDIIIKINEDITKYFALGIVR